MINKLCYNNLLNSEFFNPNNDNNFELYLDNTIQFDIAWHDAFLRLTKCIMPLTIVMNKLYLLNALRHVQATGFQKIT